MGYRNYSTQKGKIVDPNGLGDFTTIQAAINASTSGETIYIRPGTYSENISLIAGINLIGVRGATNLEQVNIIGKVQGSYSGTSWISYLRIETDGDYALEITGSNPTILNVSNCEIVASDFDGINNDCSNAGCALNCSFLSLDVEVNTLTAFSSSTAGSTNFSNFGFTNSGSTTVRSIASSGKINFSSGFSLVPITLSGTAASNPSLCAFGSTSIATIPMIISSSATCFPRNCEFASNTVAALQIDGTVIIWNCNIFSLGGTTALSGSGTVTASNLYFPGGQGITPNISPLSTYFESPQFVWTEVTGTSANLVQRRGFIPNNGALVTLTLPASSQLGSTIEVVGKGSGGWRISQNAGQSINFGNRTTTVGASGRLDSTNQFDSIRLVCTVADTTWTVLGSQGNITVT
jgi:hypothetical protein